MKLQQGREKFIEAWGTFGSNWGITPSMAQVHALLLIAPECLSAEDIMEELKIARGSANQHLRALIDWGLVQKVLIQGKRKEFFLAEKDIYKVFRQVVKERRKRELEPVFKLLMEVKEIEGEKEDPAVKAFEETINGILHYATKTDSVLKTLSKAEETWFVSALMRLMR